MTTATETLMLENAALVEGHVQTLTESMDVESVRSAALALLNTSTGRAYAAMNPIAI